MDELTIVINREPCIFRSLAFMEASSTKGDVKALPFPRGSTYQLIGLFLLIDTATIGGFEVAWGYAEGIQDLQFIA